MGGVGCLAGGGVLAAMGCTDAIKACVGQRRMQLRRELSLPSLDRVKACVDSAGCAVDLAQNHSVTDIFNALTGSCKDNVMKCAMGRRRLAANVPAVVSPKRRNLDLGQIAGCLGGGLCGLAFAGECGVTGLETMGVGCLAGGGVLAMMGCTDAIKSCVR